MYDKNRYEVTDMRRFVFLLQFVLYGVIFANAQKLIVNVPSQVAVGENFRLTYTVNTQNAKDFHIGNIPDALEVIVYYFSSPDYGKWKKSLIKFCACQGFRRVSGQFRRSEDA